MSMWTPQSSNLIAAKQEITEVIYRYCVAMDRIDRQLGLTLWHPDAEVDYGSRFVGRASDFIEWVSISHEAMEARSHQVSNILIDVDLEKQSATSESYVTAALRAVSNGIRKSRIIRGRYQDIWGVYEGRWVIANRIYRHDLDDALLAP